MVGPVLVVPSERLYERDHKLSLLLDLGAMLAREVELDALLAKLGTRIAAAMRAERATVYLIDSATGELRSRVADLPEMEEIRLPAGRGIAGYVAEQGEVVNVQDAASDPRHFPGVDRKTGYTTRTLLAAPIRDGRRAIRGVVQVLNKHQGTFTEEDEAFLLALAAQVAQALESTTLRPEADAPRGVSVRGLFNHIVGASAPMRRVYEQIARAAATDATVLLRGATGAGKGLFARAIHANCKRREAPLVTVDCTTLPAPLVESELFGHERGAYTGADRRVPGKVELAEGGTLFLDEVGELPAAAQAKLLRFLQDRSFERVGGRATLQADVRVVAATHRNLEEQVARGEFRQDLFYRLRVVEILLPSLHERGGDEVLALAQHFLGMYTRRHDRGTMTLSPAAMAALRTHDWPGNVRELEHAIERAVVLTPGEVIEPELLGLPLRAASLPPAAPTGRVSLAPARGAVGAVGAVGGAGAVGAVVGAGAGTAAGAAAGAGAGARAQESAEGAVVLPLGLPLEEVERRYVAATLAAQKGNRTRAAQVLGVGRNTLNRKSRKARE